GQSPRRRSFFAGSRGPARLREQLAQRGTGLRGVALRNPRSATRSTMDTGQERTQRTGWTNRWTAAHGTDCADALVRSGNLAEVRVAGSNPVVRSLRTPCDAGVSSRHGRTHRRVRCPSSCPSLVRSRLCGSRFIVDCWLRLLCVSSTVGVLAGAALGSEL